MIESPQRKSPVLELTWPVQGHPVKIRRRSFYRLSFRNGKLRLSGLMQSRTVMTKATGDNQRLWELGDVLEFFIQLQGHDDYYEFQLAPNGKTLKLHMQNDRIFRTVPFEKRFCDVRLQVRNVISSHRGLIYSEIIVPLSELDGSERAEKIRYLAGRYHYTDGIPEISASKPMPDGEFHSTAEWDEFILCR